MELAIIFFLSHWSFLLQIRDKLLYGSLEISQKFLKMENPKKASCKSFSPVQEFKNGELDMKHLRQLYPQGIQCLRISIGAKQKSWVAITEVAVFTDEDSAAEPTPAAAAVGKGEARGRSKST